MTHGILVIVEQHRGVLNRASWETIAAAQAISHLTEWPLEIAVVGSGIENVARELAVAQAVCVYRIESPQCDAYTADAILYVLKQFLGERQPRLVLMPHTYQVRDFAPSLALALGSTVIPDVIGFRCEGNKLLLTRQMFQGKFFADVSFTGDPPWMATIQTGAFRGDQVERGAAPVETVTISVPENVIRVHPHEVFRETKQAVDLSQSEVIVAVGRGIQDPKNLPLAEELAKLLGGDIAASRPICDAGWLPMDRQIGSSGQTVAPKLYFALGISGAIQHIVGMKGSRRTIAINKDAAAPIFEIADIGIVANLFDVLPPLMEEIRKVKPEA
jgi:electron transfer flavoprotein alpha subunit